MDGGRNSVDGQDDSGSVEYREIEVNTDLTMHDIETMERAWKDYGSVEDFDRAEVNSEKQAAFRVENIYDDVNKFYTGFATFSALMVCFNVLGPAVNSLTYRSSIVNSSAEQWTKSKRGQKRSLSPLNEFFLLLVHLRLGLFEQDLAYRFGISQSSVSRILLTSINFVYLQLKQIPLWAPRSLVFSNMLNVFKTKIQE